MFLVHTATSTKRRTYAGLGNNSVGNNNFFLNYQISVLIYIVEMAICIFLIIDSVVSSHVKLKPPVYAICCLGIPLTDVLFSAAFHAYGKPGKTLVELRQVLNMSITYRVLSEA